MKKTNFKRIIDSLGVKLPDLDKFNLLGDMTSLWVDEHGGFIPLNYERGPLLYALIAKYRPETVLEFGTAKGYSTLSMAWAMEDFDIPGTIYTVDIIPTSKKQKVPINRGNKPELSFMSVDEIWDEIAPSSWIQKIKPLTGFSADIMRKTELPKIDFAYIDGAHFYEGVQHDFFAFLEKANDRFGVLFDDYIEREQYGVKRFIDDDISKYFDVTLIDTDAQRYFTRYTGSDYGMCWIDSDSIKKPIKEICNENNVKIILDKYYRFEKRLAMRYKINQKIPFMSGIKFNIFKK